MRRRGRPRGHWARRSAALSRALLGGALLGLAGVAARAGDVSGYVELSYSDSKSHFESPAAPSSDLEGLAWTRRANVVWTRRLFPNVLMQLGAFYERTDANIAESGFERDTVATNFRPFARFTLRSKVWLAEASWYRDEDTFRANELATFQVTRDTVLGVLGWYPSELPSVRLEASRTEDRDAARQFEDRTQDIVRLTSEYTPVPSTRIYYRGLLDREDDRLTSTEFTTVAHTGEVRFGDAYFDHRWEVNANWNGGTRRVDVVASGTGEILIPDFAVFGGYDLDDTPDDGTLPPLPALIDGNTLVGTAINLGLPPPAGDARPRNFGVDLGLDRDMDVARVWIDRELPPEISSRFTWEIWTSTDGQFWTRRSTVAAAPFGPFDNRFELRFPFVNTRYLKVVVRPLAPTVPSAASYPTILVTELELFISKASGSTTNSSSITRNLVQANSRFRILERPGLYYEASFYGVTSSGSPTNWTLSNGLSIQHRFDRVWSIFARASREDGFDRGGKRVAYLYSAAVNSDPLETLRHSLTFSVVNEDREGLRTSSAGVFLNSTATVYHGIDLNASAGTSHNAVSNGPTTDTLQYHLGAMLLPHPTLTVTINLDDRDSTLSFSRTGDVRQFVRSAELAVAFSPASSVYFFASRRFEQRSLEQNRTIDALAASWSPFPGGTLRFGLNYTENRNTLYDERDRSLTPTLRWNINGASYFEATYQYLTTESDLGRSHQSVLAGILHFGF